MSWPASTGSFDGSPTNTTTLISVSVTPWAVAPPFLPVNGWTHGGAYTVGIFTRPVVVSQLGPKSTLDLPSSAAFAGVIGPDFTSAAFLCASALSLCGVALAGKMPATNAATTNTANAVTRSLIIRTPTSRATLSRGPDDNPHPAEVLNPGVRAVEVSLSLRRDAKRREVGPRLVVGVARPHVEPVRRPVEMGLGQGVLGRAVEVPFRLDDRPGAGGHLDERREADRLAAADVGPHGTVNREVDGGLDAPAGGRSARDVDLTVDELELGAGGRHHAELDPGRDVTERLLEHPQVAHH